MPLEIPQQMRTQIRQDAIAEHVEALVGLLGYDIEDQHFAKTPQRVAKWLLEFQSNSNAEDAARLLEAQFDDEHNSLVLVGPSTVTSMCAHHWLPVTGKAWVGYIPNGTVVGLSKLARIVDYYSKQFTVQERVTQEVADVLMDELKPLGVMVVIEANHGCMQLRGVKEPAAITVTSAVRGVFKDEVDARTEFLTLMRR